MNWKAFLAASSLFVIGAMTGIIVICFVGPVGYVISALTGFFTPGLYSRVRNWDENRKLDSQ